MKPAGMKANPKLLHLYQKLNLPPRKILRPLPPVVLGSPKPVNEVARPASVTNGSTLLKLKWLNTFVIVAGNSNEVLSETLTLLKTAKLAKLVIASCASLRGVLPNGVPNTPCAVKALMMYRTSLLVIFVGRKVLTLKLLFCIAACN